MTTFRSPRLETLLRTTVAEATYDHVHSLVDNNVSESFDLDYKRELYGRKDKDKQELRADVAALANAAGGVIILGIDEDKQSRAVAAPGVETSDEEVNRIYQVVASGLSPLPGLEVHALPEPGHSTGFILIAVPPSPARPHAVMVNDGFRYPHRVGTTKAYWSEPEVAAAYRDRFTGLQDRADQLVRYERDLAQTLDTEEHTFVIVSLLPDRPGMMQIDAHAERAFRSEILGKRPMIAGLAVSWMRTRVGPRRLFASTISGNQEAEDRVACELHADGGGAFASFVGHRRNQDGSPSEGFLIGDELLVLNILGSLRFLGQHARDRAAAAGNVSLRATIYPASAEVPAQLVHYRSGFTELVGSRTVRSAPAASTVADIDLLAEGGPGLVAAAYRLASDLFQEFGSAEAVQLTREGALRRPYWSSRTRPVLEGWAEQADVDWVDETLPL